MHKALHNLLTLRVKQGTKQLTVHVCLRLLRPVKYMRQGKQE